MRLSPVSSPRLAWPALAGGRARGLKAWLPAIRAGGRPSSPNCLEVKFHFLLFASLQTNKASSPFRSCRRPPAGSFPILFSLTGRLSGRKNRRIWLSERRSPLRPGQWSPHFSFSVSVPALAAMRPISGLVPGCSQGRPRRRQLKNASHGRRPSFHAVESDVSVESLPPCSSSGGEREAAWA